MQEQRNSTEEPPHMTIMLLGSTGAGKSASGNTILNRAGNPFEEDFSPEAVTRICQSEQTEVDGQTITVIDTVGLSDTEVEITDAQTQIEEMLQRTNDGIDVFLLVINLGENFRKNDSKVVKWIHDNFGAKFLKHTIVLFTQGDQLHAPIVRFLNECEALRSVVDQCSGGFHVFNNKDKDRSRVPELLEKIESLRIKNEYKRYTLQDYRESQKDIILKKCIAGAAAAAAGTILELGAVAVIAGGTAGGAAGAAVGGAAGGEVGGAAVGGVVGWAVGSVVGGAVGAAAGGAVIGLVGETGGAVIGAVIGLVGETGGAVIGAVVGAVGGALGAVEAKEGAVLAAAAVVSAGVYLLAGKYTSNEKDKSNSKTLQESLDAPTCTINE